MSKSSSRDKSMQNNNYLTAIRWEYDNGSTPTEIVKIERKWANDANLKSNI